MDISNAILLAKFLRTCRLVLGIALVGACAVGLIVGVGSGWWLSLVGLAAAFAVVIYPHRAPLLAFASLLVLATVVLGTSCLWWVFRILASKFTLGVIAPFGAILLGFYWFWHMRGPTAKKYEDPLVPESFALLPSFFDIWLSAGWRSWLMYFIVLVGSFMVGIPTEDQVWACFLLGLALLSSIAVILFFVPALKALVDGFALALIRTITRNRTENSAQSYLLFLLRNIVRNRRATGWLLRAPLFVAGILLVSIIIQSFTGPVAQIGFGASTAALAAVMLCWRRASQFALMGAAKKIDLRTETFIVFLRSFMDDDVYLERDSFIFRLLSLSFLAPGGSELNDFPDRNPRLRRFEELIAEVVWPFGKLVALGRPGEKLPQTGAIRVETDPTVGWQGTVEHLIAGARHGLIAVGISKGLKWEFQQFDSETRRMKLSLVLLPERGSLLADWRVFAAQYPKMLAYPEHELKQSLAVRFDQAGSPIFIRGREKTAEAYRIAINTCLLPTEQFLQIAGRPPSGLLTLPAAA